MSPSNMRAFSAPFMTVRGDMTVEISPAMKAFARHIGDADHRGDKVFPFLCVIGRALREDDFFFFLIGEIVELADNRPAVHLALVDLLRAVIKPRCIAEADRIGRRENAESFMRRDDFVLVEQGEAALRFEDTLDHKHDVGAARIIFIKGQRDGILQRPWQQALRGIL